MDGNLNFIPGGQAPKKKKKEDETEKIEWTKPLEKVDHGAEPKKDELGFFASLNWNGKDKKESDGQASGNSAGPKKNNNSSAGVKGGADKDGDEMKIPVEPEKKTKSAQEADNIPLGGSVSDYKETPKDKSAFGTFFNFLDSEKEKKGLKAEKLAEAKDVSIPPLPPTALPVQPAPQVPLTSKGGAKEGRGEISGIDIDKSGIFGTNLIKEQSFVFFEWKQRIIIVLLAVFIPCFAITGAYYMLKNWGDGEREVWKKKNSEAQAIENEFKAIKKRLEDEKVNQNIQKIQAVNALLDNHIYWNRRYYLGKGKL